jgi:hypothetical protein
MNSEKQAILIPGLVGGAAGASFSPSGRRGDGFVHGMSRGIGMHGGAAAGGLTGSLAGLGVGSLLSQAVPEDYKGLALSAPTAIGLLGGAGLGGYGGYHAGAGIAKGITGKNAPWQSKAKKKPEPKKDDKKETDDTQAKAAAEMQRHIDAIMAQPNVSLSEKAAMIKAAAGTYAYGMGPASASAQVAPQSAQGGTSWFGDPNRSWSEWADGQEDDLTTAIGIKKSPEYLAHSIRQLERTGRTEDAARLRAALPQGYNDNSGMNAYDSVSESRKPSAQKPAPATKPEPASAVPNHYMNAGMGAAAGGAAGAMLGPKNRLRNAMLGAALGGAGTYAGSHLASGGNLNTMLAGLGMGGKTAAFDFGKMLGDAGTYAKDMYNKIPEGVRSGMGAGGIGGAALGGLAGLIAPGEEDQYDDMGNVVSRKRRNRFGAALRGVLGGGALGAGAGALAGYAAPNHVQGAMNYMQNRGADMRDAVMGKRLDGMSQIPGRALPQASQPGMPSAMMA